MIPCTRPLLAMEHTEFDAGAEQMAFGLARTRAIPLAIVLPLVANVEYEAVAPALVARDEEAVHEHSLAVRTAAQSAGASATVRVRRHEEAWRAIVAEATAMHADLVIVRRRGRRSFLANLMIGEMVGKVATEAPCSVLLVPRAARSWRQRVLAAIDTTPLASGVARAAADAARAAQLPLTLVSVAAHDTPAARAAADVAVRAAADVVRGEGLAVECRVAAGRPAETIAALAAQLGADLLVVGRGGPRAHGRWHFGSNAQRIAGLAACAVLVVRP
ncbi:MAG: universal stress protein [Burkholderiales bacterium]